MFTQIFFVISIALLAELAPQSGVGFDSSPLFSHWIGIGVYLLSLGLIALQNQIPASRKIRQFLLLLANVELLAALTFALFLCDLDALFPGGPLGTALITFSLYFAGLALFSFTIEKGRKNQVHFRPLRFVAPFIIPFLLFQGLLSFVPENPNPSEGIGLAIGGLLFLILCICLFPYVVQKLWGCTPLPSSVLHHRLKLLCKRANFTYGGMKEWGLMHPMPTAAILGVISKFRYILFTPKLMEVLSPESIEAVLAHEIGHSKHKHLLIYPFVLFSVIATAGIITEIYAEPALDFLALQNLFQPNALWSALEPIALFIPYIFLLGLFFRLIFGHYSRLFERQADLHPLTLGLPAKHMIQALDELAIAAGGIHDDPSWHHQSIAKRIRYLQEVERKPEELQLHNKKVRRNLFYLGTYLLILMPILAAPFFQNMFPFSAIHHVEKNIKETLSSNVTNGLRSSLATRVQKHLGETSDSLTIHAILKRNFSTYGGSRHAGIALFYTAEEIFQKDSESAALLLIEAWHTFNFSQAKGPLLARFSWLTKYLLTEDQVSLETKQKLSTVAHAKGYRDEN